MNENQAATLEELLRTNGLAWVIEVVHPADKVLAGLLDLLDRVTDDYERRIGQKVSFTPSQLATEAQRNPHKVKAFLQALGCSHSPEMLVMVWRILQGLDIREVSVTYRARETFAVDVCLGGNGEGEDGLEHYRSGDINDVTLLRHFGVAIINGKPLFEGFYAYE